MTPEDGEVFGWVGLSDGGDHYVAATGIYDYFWALSRDTREKLITGWVEALESYLDPEIEERVKTKETGGDLIYFEGQEVIESKPSKPVTSATIIQFPTKK